MAFGVNVPLPLVVHVALVAEPPMVPASVAVLVLQMVCGGPASTIACWLNVMVTTSEAGKQGPAGSSVVIVRITEPLIRSLGPGV